MKRDEVIALAREAGIVWGDHTITGSRENLLERFAALVEEHLKAEGYRHCAKGQRTTQWCGMLEQAVAAWENKYGMKEWQAHALRAGWMPAPPQRKPLP